MKKKSGLTANLSLGLLMVSVVIAGCKTSGVFSGQPKWWKGVTHVHSTWSDGSSYPEVVANWYKQRGYNFIVVTDHDTIQAGTKWKKVQSKSAESSLAAYRSAFGDKWVEVNGAGKDCTVRCRQLSEYRDKVEKPGQFIIVRGEEITCRNDKRNAHVVAVNLAERIEPKVGKNVVETFETSINSVSAQGQRLKRKTLPILCHPNWGEGPSVEEVWPSSRVRYFEVVNGLAYNVWNTGDRNMLSMDKLWDIALAKRIQAGNRTELFGIAADDMHRLDIEGGAGWIMVKCSRLDPEQIVTAIDRGEFYATTGVILKDVGMKEGKFRVEVQPEQGVTYTIQFIGTPRDYDKSMENAVDDGGKLLSPVRRYSQDIGKVLQETKGVQASYTMGSAELYVRAKVISSKLITAPNGTKIEQCAWSQPVIR